MAKLMEYCIGCDQVKDGWCLDANGKKKCQAELGAI